VQLLRDVDPDRLGKARGLVEPRFDVTAVASAELG
jgi:hypothetical protein